MKAIVLGKKIRENEKELQSQNIPVDGEDMIWIYEIDIFELRNNIPQFKYMNLIYSLHVFFIYGYISNSQETSSQLAW